MQEEIIKSLLASSSLTAILFLIVWFWFSEKLKSALKLANKKIEHEYKEKLASYTAELDKKNEMELAAFKQKLELAAAERSFRFSHIFERTAESIATTHQKLIAWREAIDKYNVTFNKVSEAEREQLAKERDERYQEFVTFYRRNKIYIPNATTNNLQVYLTAQETFARDYEWLLKYEDAPQHDQSIIDKEINKMLEMSKEVQKLADNLDDDFQQILGFPPLTTKIIDAPKLS